MLQGRRVRLRAVERADLPAFVQWFNDPVIQRRLARVEPLSLAEEERWFEALQRSKADVVYAVVVADGLVGTCGLHRIDWRHRCAELGIVIGDDAYRGQGHGSDAVRTLVDHAFGNLGLHRIELEVLADNEPARRCYERLGFVDEGVRREARYIDGGFKDLVWMRILHHEWPAASTREAGQTRRQPRSSSSQARRARRPTNTRA
jgi:diamine N-acetyltransferase